MDSNNLKRSCTANTQYLFESDLSLNSSTGGGAFHLSDDDKDLDFRVPAKVSRSVAHSDARTKMNKSKAKSVPKPKAVPKLKAVLKPASNKPLTAAQRLARLKKKTDLYKKVPGVQKPSRVDCNPLNVTQTSITLAENLDHMFVVGEKNNSGVNVGSSSSESSDSLNCNGTTKEAIDGTAAGEESFVLINVPSTFEVPQNSDVAQLMLEMRNQMNDLCGNVTILRKQMARVELKSLQMCSCMGRSRSQMSPDSIDSDMLFDFEGALSREGLPLKTVDEVNDFERKLKSSEYRMKLVRIFVFNSSSLMFDELKLELFDLIQ